MRSDFVQKAIYKEDLSCAFNSFDLSFTSLPRNVKKLSQNSVDSDFFTRQSKAISIKASRSSPQNSFIWSYSSPALD